MPRPDYKQDFRDLQNGMSMLSQLAASAPAFLSALAAAQRVLSGFDEAEQRAVDAAAEQKKAQDAIAFLKVDIERLSEQRDSLQAAAKDSEAYLVRVEGKRAAAIDSLNAELAQRRAEETAKFEREAKAVEDELQERLGHLRAEVATLEERRKAAETAIGAIKASL